MFEEILSSQAINIIESLSPHLDAFYLAGGTGLALQLGYRKSHDLDFFSDAEQEPSPLMILSGEAWKWEKIKAFFLNNIELFEHELRL